MLYVQIAIASVPPRIYDSNKTFDKVAVHRNLCSFFNRKGQVVGKVLVSRTTSRRMQAALHPILHAMSGGRGQHLLGEEEAGTCRPMESNTEMLLALSSAFTGVRREAEQVSLHPPSWEAQRTEEALSLTYISQRKLLESLHWAVSETSVEKRNSPDTWRQLMETQRNSQINMQNH